MDWQKYINEMFTDAEQHGVIVRGFHIGGGNGSVFQAEGMRMATNWDTVSGDYVAGSDFQDDGPDQETWDALFNRINETGTWEDVPMFWESNDPSVPAPAAYTGADL